jgi:hypothetical protein
MAQTAVAESRVSEVRPQKSSGFKHFVRQHWLALAAAGLIAAAAIYGSIIALNWPFEKQAIVSVLQERSARQVTIGKFYKTYFPPGCVAEQIQFLHRVHKEKQPLIVVQRLVMTTTYGRILTLQRRLTLVRVFNMHVTVPPSEPGKPNPIMPLTYSGKERASVVIDRTIADGAVLDFLSKEPGKKPFRLMIDKLRLDGIGNNEPMFYRTIISNQMPPGKIQSTGVFGTWNANNPGSTPVRGTYRFDNANLLSFGGVSGTLFSTGKFNGTLNHINVDGTTDVPNFKVTDTSHTRRLTTEFKAVVDGTKGDTYLSDVTAHFDRTTVKAKGSVAGEEGQNGKIVKLDLSEESGRIEDLLDLFISAKTPQMTGNMTFQGHFELPPGAAGFVQRMQLDGDFGGAGKFTDKETEADITRLSDSAEKKKKSEAENPATVISDLKGRAVARNGIARLSHVSFTVPGAKATLEGTYNLMNYAVDLHGTLLTTGQPGDATTGFKSFLVKAISPFFKKRQSEKVVPFKLSGKYGNINASLDLGSKKK